MICYQVHELIVPYSLGCLDSREVHGIETHFENCRECRSLLAQHSDLVVHMAYAVPQVEAPIHLKRRILEKISSRNIRSAPLGIVRRLIYDVSKKIQVVDLRSNWVLPGAALAVVIFVAGLGTAVWFNKLSADKAALENQVQAMASGDAEIAKLVKDLRDLTYWANAPDSSVKLLSASDEWSGANGMVVVRSSESAIKLLTSDMPLLPAGKVFQIWLSKSKVVYNAGTLEISSDRQGTRHIILPEPAANFDAILITIEDTPVGSRPLGRPVLLGNIEDL